MDNITQLIYSPEALAFIQYGANYCALLEPESTPVWSRETIYDCRQSLAWIYATGLSLPNLDVLSTTGGAFTERERMVKEEDYDRIRTRLERVFGSEDLFLSAQVEEMKYSEIPISISTSELMADVYQQLADLLWVYRQKQEEATLEALYETYHGLLYEWGAMIPLLLKQLHDLLLNPLFDPTGE